MSKHKWTAADIGDQSGRVAIVTGANTGIGFETARALALKGADVILACRNPQKGEAAVKRLQAEGPSGAVRLELLDLSEVADQPAGRLVGGLGHDIAQCRSRGHGAG